MRKMPWLKLIPKTSGVYAFFSGDQCVYVGSSLLLTQRISAHRMLGHCDRIEWVACHPRDLVKLEAEQMALLRPTQNKRAAARGTAKRGWRRGSLQYRRDSEQSWRAPEQMRGAVVCNPAVREIAGEFARAA